VDLFSTFRLNETSCINCIKTATNTLALLVNSSMLSMSITWHLLLLTDNLPYTSVYSKHCIIVFHVAWACVLPCSLLNEYWLILWCESGDCVCRVKPTCVIRLCSVFSASAYWSATHRRGRSSSSSGWRMRNMRFYVRRHRLTGRRTQSHHTVCV